MVKNRLFPGYPLDYIQLPEEIVDSMEEIFGRADFTGFSRLTTTLIQCLIKGPRDGRKEAQEGRRIS